MIELLLVAATQVPLSWANEYCVYRDIHNATHEEALKYANESKGEMTPVAWAHTKTNTWCLQKNDKNV